MTSIPVFIACASVCCYLGSSAPEFPETFWKSIPLEYLKVLDEKKCPVNGYVFSESQIEEDEELKKVLNPYKHLLTEDYPYLRVYVKGL